MKIINVFIITFFLCPLWGQDCELLKSAVMHEAEYFEYYQICKTGHKYYVDEKTAESIRSRLLKDGRFDEYFIDTLLTRLQLVETQNEKKIVNCSDEQLRYLSLRKIERGFKKNFESEDKEAFIKELGKYTYFYLTTPIYFEDFAVIQRIRTITYNNSDIKILLFKKKEAAWEYVMTLYNVAN